MNNLTARVEGDIGEVDGVLRITSIRLTYLGEIPAGTTAKVNALLNVYATQCPAYQSVKDGIDVSWTSELRERPADNA